MCFVQTEPAPAVNDMVEESAGVGVKEEIVGVIEVVPDDAKDLDRELVECDAGEVCGGCRGCF